MKMQEALNIMKGVPAGFMVTFEWAGDGFLRSDHFPDVRAGEPPIATEAEAWQMAAQFAEKTRKRCVNIYVIRRDDFTPVPGYRERMIANRNSGETMSDYECNKRMGEVQPLSQTTNREPVFTPKMMEAIYAAWHGAGVDIAGGNWARFVGMLVTTGKEL